jgi:RNA polymerase sigma-70 factor, ECF subfamily
VSRPGGEASDEALAEAANAGDRGALEVLLARHLDRVHAICRRVTGHPEDALDATQEALIAVTRGLHRYDGRSLFTTWLYRVATNAALDELRRRKRRPEPAELSDDRPGRGGSFGGSAGSAPVESAVTARLDVDAALARLSPEFRAAVVLRDLCDLDYAEIAEVLDVPVGTVRSRIARGRAAIADQLREPDGPDERPSRRP